MKIDVRIKRLSENAIVPNYATNSSAGVDLSACLSQAEEILPGEVKIIPTGIAIALNPGYEAQVRPRSGLAAKNSITVLNSPGTIDADYRGEVKVILINHGKTPFIVENGMRIAQMVIAKHETANFVISDFNEDETERGAGGFGSTGVSNPIN